MNRNFSAEGEPWWKANKDSQISFWSFSRKYPWNSQISLDIHIFIISYWYNSQKSDAIKASTTLAHYWQGATHPAALQWPGDLPFSGFHKCIMVGFEESPLKFPLQIDETCALYKPDFG